MLTAAISKSREFSTVPVSNRANISFSHPRTSSANRGKSVSALPANESAWARTASGVTSGMLNGRAACRDAKASLSRDSAGVNFIFSRERYNS